MPIASCKMSSSFSFPGNQCKYKMDSGGQNQGIKNSLISVYHGTQVLPGHVLCPQDLAAGQGFSKVRSSHTLGSIITW